MARGEHAARGGRRRPFGVAYLLVSSLVIVIAISVLVRPTNSFAWSNLQRQRQTPRCGRKNPVLHGKGPSPLESPIDDERRPIRLESSFTIQQRKQQLQSETIYPWNDWGIEHKPAPQPIFPATVDSCTDAAWEAIAATLYNKQRMDPNLVQNILKGDTVHGRRPVRGRKDAGRIGIEIDGASCLFRQGETARDSSNTNNNNRINASAIRRVSLILAGKLSQSPWKGYEKPVTSNSTSTTSSEGRQVAVYFNTIKQALAASHELQLLKRIERHGQTEAQYNRGIDSSSSTTTSYYDNVRVLCLGQNEGIPKDMREQRVVGNKKKPMAASLATGEIDPQKGLVLIVQPTDYNAEYRPPGPSVGTVEALQKLVASAAIEHVPTVVLSPRFLANEIPYSGGSWDQSGFQQSAIYGGIEPPRGPTPWVMRDFSPPVFSWVGCALPLGRTSKFRDAMGEPCYYSGVSLVQSVMYQAHSWHLFATKEQSGSDKQQEQRTTASSTAAKSSSSGRTSNRYQYLASTKSASGRPTRDVLRRIFGEFAPYD
jgi:hypothetical protein